MKRLKSVYRIAGAQLYKGLLKPLLFSCLVAITITACDSGPVAPESTGNTSLTTTEGYTGMTSCKGCHEAETSQWEGSHHDLAMQVANPTTALGNFNDSRFEHHNVTSRFFTEGENLFVETDGSDGSMATFPVRYTFGVYPLQQYLLELPDGKIQALSIAWDSRPATEGGQRWFHLYGEEKIDHTDVLHWTKLSQNWETMCADCHSTNLVSNYDLAEDRFDTRWDELNVSCEACHGPGANHIAWAENPDPEIAGKGLDISLDESKDVNWVLNPETGNSSRSIARTTNKELNTCAACHSRRSRIAEGNHPATPFLDNYSPALIEQPLYHADGQILDEVYVYGSFLQSKMHAEGVSCSDCHDPHSLELKAPGPQVCLQCHASETFATTQHQLHEPEKVNCIDCHMPATTYMQIDARNDHSFRIPRPQLSVAYGTPNACNECHTDKDAAWALATLEKQGRISAADIHWSEALALTSAGGQTSIEAQVALAAGANVPPIIRATAISNIQLTDSLAAQQLLRGFANSEEPMVRWGAARALNIAQPELAASEGYTLLNDPVRSVRLSAASALNRLDPVMLPADSYRDTEDAYEEYKTSQLVNAERPEAHINIANAERVKGRLDTAESGYKTAIQVNPYFVPAYVNLADLYREWGREADAEKTLRTGLDLLPNQASLHHALGLSLIRQNRTAEAISELQIAAEAPDATPRFALVYAIALNSTGQSNESLRFLEKALQRFGNDPELQQAFTQFSQQLK